MTPAAVLAGLGSQLPPRLVTNDELAARLDSSDEWIRTRTGIRQRYVATEGLLTSDLAAGAGALALKSAGLAQVDAVLVATTTPDRPCPATAPTVAEKLGLGQVAAFDVSAVCTGFLYALATASGLIASGTARHVLVIGAETFSRILDPADRATSVIFGDGAGAVVLRAGHPEEPGALGPFALGSDGSGQDLITVPRGGPPAPAETATDGYYFTMQGKTVFRLAVQRMGQSIRAALDRAGLRIDDVDRLVGHQANLRILLRLADEIGLPRERSYSHIAEVGNTAAASLPLALDHAHAEGALRPGDRVLLAAFGGGLTWGAVTLTWPAVDRG
ncbi:beta-ketoacyl-ACP synthase III [Streptomyces sp. AC495_CC817]|uniref:beta-ketoacyl-ACP synthase III n=1 Tax=Streptomyces sp. AC495_CC817 TaxID=2823900 RepID=UPI001C266761|nr:beta-ketoacyl-ACP synthase III [Streptomyces sp. AC495_CC817]